MVIKGITLNDLHFGINDTERLYKELHQVTDFLKVNTDIQLIVIAGDYFDRKLSVGDTATYLAMSFFKQLVDIAKEHHIKLRMIQGTLSHELNQLQLFSPYQSDPDLDFKIIWHVSDEKLLGLDILYIPEEYPQDVKAYYDEYKKKSYNIGFVHGTFDFVAFDNQIEHSEQTETNSAPVFIWNEWKDAFKDGFFSVGHIHGRNVYSNKIYYSGSFTRWGFGERSARGFTYYEYDTDTKKYKVKFIDNTEAPVYEAVKLKTLLENNNSEITIDAVKKVIEEQQKTAQYVAVDMADLPDDLVEFIKSTYNDDKSIKLENKAKKVLLKESRTQSDEAKKAAEKYKYIIKRELPLAQIIQKFIKEDMGKDIPLETIEDILKEEGTSNEA